MGSLGILGTDHVSGPNDNFLLGDRPDRRNSGRGIPGGGNRWNDAEGNRLVADIIADLWPKLSDGRCGIIMVKDRRREWIGE